MVWHAHERVKRVATSPLCGVEAAIARPNVEPPLKVHYQNRTVARRSHGDKNAPSGTAGAHE